MEGRMTGEVVAIVLTGAGVLIGVWRIVTVQVESVRRDVTGALHREIGAVREDIRGVRTDLTAQIAAVNTHIDNILLADRTAARGETP
jgi:predicted nucleic acid-binding protein